MTDKQARQWCKDNGVRFADLRDCAKSLQDQYNMDREYYNAIHKRIWEMFAYTPGSVNFWRNGMRSKFPAAFDGGDCDLIPGFDTAAQALALEFPEFAGDDQTEKVWDFVQSDYYRAKSVREFYSEATQLVGSSTSEVVTDDGVPF